MQLHCAHHAGIAADDGARGAVAEVRNRADDAIAAGENREWNHLQDLPNGWPCERGVHLGFVVLSEKTLSPKSMNSQ